MGFMLADIEADKTSTFKPKTCKNTKFQRLKEKYSGYVAGKSTCNLEWKSRMFSGYGDV